MFRLLLIAHILLFIFPHCKNSNSDSTSQTSADVQKEGSIIINNQTPAWVSETLNSTAFNQIQKDEYAKGDSLNSMPFTPSSGFYKTYAALLRWSPDSSYILDLGSSGRVIVQDSGGNTRIESGEPDTEVALIDPKNRKRSKLMVVGPSTEIIDGSWITTSRFLLLGKFEESNKKTDTLVWMVDINNGLFTFYDLKGFR